MAYVLYYFRKLPDVLLSGKMLALLSQVGTDNSAQQEAYDAKGEINPVKHFGAPKLARLMTARIYSAPATGKEKNRFRFTTILQQMRANGGESFQWEKVDG